MMTQRSTVMGVFESHAQADRAVDALRRAGFQNDRIGVVARNEKGTVTTTGAGEETYAEEGAIAGAVAGAGIGGLVGLGVIAGVIPVIGPAIAAGTLGTILLNAAGGAAIATVTGALIGLGIPEEEAEYYEGELKSGRYLVTVQADNRAGEAWSILQQHGAYNCQNKAAGTVCTTGTATATGTTRTTSAGTAGTATAGQTMKLHEEHLHAHKQPVQTGEVRVRKEVVTEHKTLDVPVQREEVVIERHGVTGQRACSSDIRAGEEIRIPVSEEQVRVEKENVVKEEVTVGKRKVQDTEHVAGTVRKEQVKVEREGDVNVRSSGSTDIKNKGGRPAKGS